VMIAALWAPQIQRFGSVVKYFQELLSYIAPPVVAVFLLGLFWKRATGTGALAALVSGLAMAVALLFFLDRTPMAGWHFLYRAPVLFAVSALILVSVSLFTDPPRAEAVERFVWRPAIFREETAELKGVAWYQNYRVLTFCLLVASAIFILVWR